MEADLDELTLPDGEGTAPEAELLRRERQMRVKEAIFSMEPVDREIFLRYYYYLQPAPEIAEAMRLTPVRCAPDSRAAGRRSKTTFTGGIIMRVKLTDLLDDLELDPELLPLPEAKRPTRARTERLVLQRLGISRRRVRSAGRTLLAAVIAALLSLAAVAGALGLLEISRADLGVTQPEKIPEYTEYEVTSEMDGARLVSSFCAGKRLIAYVDVPDVTAEMNRAYQEAMDTYGLSLWSCRAKPYSVWAEALTYDESLQTALLRVELYTYEALEPGEATIELCLDSQENGHETAGEVFATVTVPVCPPKPYRQRRAFRSLRLPRSIRRHRVAHARRRHAPPHAASAYAGFVSERARRRCTRYARQGLLRAGHGKSDGAGRAGRLSEKLERRAERAVCGCGA